MIRLSPTEAETLAAAALEANGASPGNASSTARALVAAEVDGQSGHGLARVPAYAAQVKVGKVRGDARPSAVETRAASLMIDAQGGFAYPALDLAVERLPALAGRAGVAAAGIHASHHMGQAGLTVERLADRGLVALVASNTPRAMAFHGGARPMMGTNPLAFAAPMPGRAPLVIDLALSLVARSKIVAAQKAGRPIPADWAIDAQGSPTEDPAAALQGALLPVGGAKGAALALMVEILCAALAGGRFGWQASSFLDDRGDPPGVGQLLIALDPAAFAGPSYAERMKELLAAIGSEPGVRLPGDRRLESRERSRREGLKIAPDLHAQLLGLSGRSA
ncbi:MAG: Ldh family oxidoreductase [Gammaproteobacteria bacterium]|nr:Ldh family oxidoreductase [Gammaproteobacteria bacterium]